MDRLNQLRSEAGGSGDSTLDTSSLQSEAYLTANDNSKYFSLLDESSFSISKETVNPDQEEPAEDKPLISNLSPIPKKTDLVSYKIGKQIEAANILSGGVNIFDENSYEGDELVIDDNAPQTEEKLDSEGKVIGHMPVSKDEDNMVATIDDVEPAIPSKDTEVVLQIDGKNVDAIDIGNGLYLYRKEGQEELAAVQIINDDQQQSSFKFLKVRENIEGNLEVYEEIEIEVPKEVASKEGKSAEDLLPVPIKDINKVFIEPTRIDEIKIKTPQKDTSANEIDVDLNKESQSDSKSDVNRNGKMMKFSESRKSPIVGSFTPMTFHSTPNKEGIPLTKTMVDQQLQPSRHSDNIKKTIEVHTDSCKLKNLDITVKSNKENCETKIIERLEKDYNQTSEEKLEENVKLVEKEATGDQANKNMDNLNNEENKIENVIENASGVDHSTRKNYPDNKRETIVKNAASTAVIETYTQNKEDNEIATESNNTKSFITSQKNISENCTDIGSHVESEDNIPKDPVELNKDWNEKGSFNECKDSQSETINKNLDTETISNKSEIKENIIVECKQETHTMIDDNNPTSVTNIEVGCAEIPKIVTNIAVQEQQVERESTKSRKDTNNCQVQNIMETEKKTTESTHNECTNYVSNLNPTNVENEKQINEYDQDKEDKINQKISTDELTKEAINHKAIEAKALISDTSESTEQRETSQVSNKIQSNIIDEAQNDLLKINKNVSLKAGNNNNAAVPFGKWTEANRQEFLNKIKETKVTSNNPNTKQIKQPNDLNRRDILQKIDSQRQQSNNAMAKVQEQQKVNSKNETSAFSKSNTDKHATKIPMKERLTGKTKPAYNKKNPKDYPSVNHPNDSSNLSSITNTHKKESLQRREINNQALIDKTIEEIINRVPPGKNSNEDRKQNVSNTEGIEKQKGMTLFGPSYHAKNEQSVTLDEIEMKMNELHGIPFVERPAHELPQKFIVDNTVPSKNESPKSIPSNVPKLLPFAKNSQQLTNEEVLHIDSDEEVIEHEPITGDLNPKKISTVTVQKVNDLEIKDQAQKVSDASKKDVIITEKDFDKFFRRNSVTYENCLTVNFDGKEPHNVVQTVVEKDAAPKKLTRNEVLLAESKAKSTHKQQMLQARHNNYSTKILTSTKYQAPEDESYGKNYQSKLQIAYQTAMTAKRQKESPIKIIEEKPVKVVFMDSNVNFQSSQLNVQGEKLSPTKQFTSDLETFTHSTTDSLDSDILDNFDSKSQDEAKTKNRHQRKQVLTPVEAPEMELIESKDLGIDISPKKKRKIEDKLDKSPRNHVPKKSYLLGRANADEKSKTPDVENISFKEKMNHHNSFVAHSNPITAIDNLVKAAELLDNQAENSSSSSKTPDSDSQQHTPVKRGRGRPRKYPLPDGEAYKNKVPSPQKKPRLIDAKVVKREETDEEDTSDEEIIKENWTMGKINENIVCPICNKLFRSENVVFKHVKHCTGPSPNRSESDKRRLRESQESETKSHGSKSDDMDLEEQEVISPKKRKSKDSNSKFSNSDDDAIEETLLKEKTQKHDEPKKPTAKTKVVNKSNNNLVCEICGKTFRHISYLTHHKLQHKNDDLKKQETDKNIIKSVFCCEVCKKEFRKLHHLVQHRIIHNPSSIPTRTLRKSSSEQGDRKVVKEQNVLKQTEDHSPGFRCEPCDKSFRKLHHLVEHRETHDGKNRQKAIEVETVKSALIHQCDICDKTFRKLQLLNEHKEQHLETLSEKSDDKSVKSSLSTKDIIHECSMCYMVFPNEHSLNKHTIICLRKKKQSAAKAKQAALKKESEGETLDSQNPQPEEFKLNDKDDSLIILEDTENSDVRDIKENKLKYVKPVGDNKPENPEPININNAGNPLTEQKYTKPVISIKYETVKKSIESKEKKAPEKALTEMTVNKEANIPPYIPAKVKQNDENLIPKATDTPVPKKKTPAKDKVAPTVTKRLKSINVPIPVVEDMKPLIEPSDEDDVRYMLNPDFKEDKESEEKSFLRVKTNKRNSLQIERPSSRDLVKRRISMQHPPKISRLKTKPVEQSPAATMATSSKSTLAKNDKQPTNGTDSDDSEIKYAFPETIKDVAPVNEGKKPLKRKSLTLKRKSLSGVAKRKSLGKAINSKHKVKLEPPKQIKKRTTEVAEHRCDCGKLFSSAALLSRHTTLDHTPPRSRRRRSPIPEIDTTSTKQVTRKFTSPKTNVKTKIQPKKPVEQGKAESSKPGVATRKSSMNNNDAKPPSRETRKSLKSISSGKSPRSVAHKGVPIPEGLKKHVAKQHLKKK